MTIYEQLVDVCAASSRRLLSAAALRAMLAERYGTNPSSILPSDHSFNRWNVGLRGRWRPIFDRQETGDYLYLGAGHRYTGLVYARPRGERSDRVVGEWVDGVPTIYAESRDARPAENFVPPKVPRVGLKDALPLSLRQIERLLAEYTHILKLETTEFGCKPTETRHLVGRLGELFCASRIGGTLATRVNQSGFDVVASDGRTISVKTTAQRSGFVPIKAATLDRADDLMILQYDVDDGLKVIYYGEARAAVEGVRFAESTGCFELDLARAKRLDGRPLPA